VKDERLASAPLLTETPLRALPHQHARAWRRRLTLDSARQERFIVLDEMHCVGEQIVAFCREREVPAHGVPQHETGHRQGVSLLPAMARRATTAAASFIRLS